MKTLYESILSSTGTGKTVIIKAIEKRDFTPIVIKTLEKTVALYKVKNKNELKTLINVYIKDAGNTCSLNWIDTSEVTDMSMLFSYGAACQFNGDISEWDVSNVEDMNSMFDSASKFNQDISKWNVKKVNSMYRMFCGASKFNQDISKWNVSRVKNMSSMFNGASAFNQDISKWNVSNVENMYYMFQGASAFNQDISGWNVKNVKLYDGIFTNCPIKPEYKPKFR